MKIILAVFFSMSILFAQVKLKPVYVLKKDKLASIQTEATQLNEELRKVIAYGEQLKSKQIYLEGRYQEASSMPDSFIVRYDTLKVSK